MTLFRLGPLWQHAPLREDLLIAPIRAKLPSLGSAETNPTAEIRPWPSQGASMRLRIGHHALVGSRNDFDSRASGMQHQRLVRALAGVLTATPGGEGHPRPGQREVEVLSPNSPRTHP